MGETFHWPWLLDLRRWPRPSSHIYIARPFRQLPCQGIHHIRHASKSGYFQGFSRQLLWVLLFLSSLADRAKYCSPYADESLQILMVSKSNVSPLNLLRRTYRLASSILTPFPSRRTEYRHRRACHDWDLALERRERGQFFEIQWRAYWMHNYLHYQRQTRVDNG